MLGYITHEEQDYFCHQSDIHASGFRALTEGAEVEFEKSEDATRDNKLRALKVIFYDIKFELSKRNF